MRTGLVPRIGSVDRFALL